MDNLHDVEANELNEYLSETECVLNAYSNLPLMDSIQDESDSIRSGCESRKSSTSAKQQCKLGLERMNTLNKVEVQPIKPSIK